jgi:general secretion pathway protein D
MKKLAWLLLATLLLMPMALPQAAEPEKVQQEIGVLVEQNLIDGKELYAKEEYAAAEQKFETILQYDETHAEAREYIQLCKYHLGLRSASGEPLALSPSEKEKIDRLYEQGCTLMEAGDFSGASEKLEELLKINPMHIPARRRLADLEAKRAKIAKQDRKESETAMINDIDNTWSVKSPKKDVTEGKKYGREKVKTPQIMQMEESVRVVIKEINFTDAHLRDVIQYLSKVSGVNIIIDEGIFEEPGVLRIEQEVSVSQPETTDEAVVPSRPVNASDRVTIILKDIPLINALGYILRTKNLKFRIDEYAILVSTPERLALQDMETRYYHLSSGIGAFANQELPATMSESTTSSSSATASDTSYSDVSAGETSSADSSVSEDPMTPRKILESAGIPFPGGSSVLYDKRTSTLIVRNTPDNLSLVEDLLEKIDVMPFQIEIETRFIEVSEGNMTQLGFEWMLKSPVPITKMNNQPNIILDSQNYDDSFGQYPGSSVIKGDAPANYGLTKGLRFYEEGGKAMGNILSLSGILSDPEFRVVMHALDQSGRANELSAPKVTTINNQQAKIEVVEELRYPGGYDVTPPTVSDLGTIVTPPVVTPTDFLTRKVGIILNVTPNVGQDKEKINLLITPEVSELVSWIDYGDTYPTGRGDSYEIRILQPVFKSKNVETNVVINDGDTIVLGGLISEEIQKIRDKVPFLGNIPILGPLFRNEGEKTTKTNLLIFVTGRLLSPSGQSLKSEEK